MILILKDEQNDKAEYLGQMLSMWGASCWEVIEPGQLPHTTTSTVIIPPGTSADVDAVRSCLKRGTHLIWITPDRDMLKELGMDYPIQYGDPGRMGYMRQVRPLLDTFSWHALPIVGRRMLAVEKHYSDPNYKVQLPSGTQIQAFMYETDSENFDRPAIWTMPVGPGKITVFAYDLVECFRDLRQGRPRFVGWRPGWDDICRPAHLFGPDWGSEFHGSHLPLADFHPMLLTRLIERNLDAPLPRFWQLPGFAQSAILVSGDEDNGDPKCNEEICSFLDTIDGHIVVYIVVQGTQTTPEQVRGWMNRGHGFSVHPYPIRKGEPGLAPAGDVLKKLEECVEEFKKRYQLPVRTIRNHRVFWTGYTDVPRLWERLGIEMNCDYNNGADLAGRSLAGCFLTPPAALPINFLDDRFAMVRVLQQPCHFGDGSLKPDGADGEKYSAEFFECFAESLVTGALKPLGIPYSVCFHPINYHRYAAEAEQRFLRKAKSQGSVLISDYDWVDFWQMRASWRMTGLRCDHSGTQFTLAGEKPSKSLALSLPRSFNGKQLCDIQIDGKEPQIATVNHFGMERLLVALPDDRSQVELKLAIKSV